MTDHKNVNVTWIKVSKKYFFSKMREKIKKYVKKCEVCVKTKKSRQFESSMQSFKISNKSWQSVTMNFITNLLKFMNSVTQVDYDEILVMMNRFSKMTKFVSIRSKQTIEQLTYILIKELMITEKMSEFIVFDRNKLFVSKFWTILMIKLDIKKKIFTAFYSQTDEQIKRLNQTLKQYLRAYINKEQNNWVELLSTTQLVYNNTSIKTMNFCFKEVQTRRKDNLLISKERSKNVTVDELNEKITLKQKQLRNDLIIVKEKMRNRKSEKEKIFKKEDKVYLQIRNFNLKEEMKKLRHTAKESFRMIRNIRNTTYELEISKFKIHNVFSASLLNKADLSTSLTRTLRIKTRQKEYEINEILRERKYKRRKKFLISWKEFESENNKWESEQNVNHARKTIAKFRKKVLRERIMLRIKQSNRAVRS